MKKRNCIKNATHLLRQGLPHHGCDSFVLVDRFESSAQSLLGVRPSPFKIHPKWNRIHQKKVLLLNVSSSLSCNCILCNRVLCTQNTNMSKMLTCL